MFALLLAGCEPSGGALRSAAPGPPPSAACGREAGASPFHRAGAIHVLVADFPDGPGGAPNEAGAIARRAEAEISGAPSEAVEVARKRCRVDGHRQAGEVAGAAGADLVIWGAPCESGAVCARATVHRGARWFRPSLRGVALDTPSELDLPAIRGGEGAPIVHFALGIAFFLARRQGAAVRFLGLAIEELPAGTAAAPAIEVSIARALMDVPNLARSGEWSRRALSRVEGSGGAIEAAAAIATGEVLLFGGEAEKASTHLKRGVAIREGGGDRRALAAALAIAGRALLEQGDAGAALEMHERALALDEESVGAAHPDVAADRIDVGRALQAKGDVAGALVEMRRGLAIDEEALGGEHARVAIDLGEIAGALRERGELASASTHLRRAVAIANKAPARDSRDIVHLMTRLGEALEAEGQRDEALASYEKAVTPSEGAWGGEHVDTAVLLARIGGVREVRGDWANARASLRRAVAIFERRLGADHAKTAAARAALARVEQRGR